MKKNYFLVGVMLCSLNLFAQITINPGDVVNAGEYVVMAYDTNFSVSPGSAGANQTWNFGSLTADEVDTLNFINPVNLQGYSYFNNANIGLANTVDSVNIFFKKDNNAFRLLGYHVYQNNTPSNYPISYNFITFPSTYNTNYNDSYAFVAASFYFGVDPDGPGPHPTVDSMRIKHRGEISSVMDAWGNVTTPLGTFASLRQNFKEVTIDSVQMYAGGQWQPLSPTMKFLLQQQGIDEVSKDSTMTLRWWSNNANARFIVVEMDWDGVSTVYSVSWLKKSPASNSVQDLSNQSVNLYPNPGSNYFVLDGNLQAAELKLWDASGRLILTCRNNQTGNNWMINTENLNQGIYIYTIHDSNGKLLQSGRWIKQ